MSSPEAGVGFGERHEQPKTEAEKWQEKAAAVKAFELTPDMSGDFTRLLSVLELTYHFTGAHIPQQMASFIVDKIEEGRRMSGGRENEVVEAEEREYGVESAKSKLDYYAAQLKLMEDFIARHGGDVEREKLGLEQAA